MRGRRLPVVCVYRSGYGSWQGAGRSVAPVLEAADVPDPVVISSLTAGTHTTRITGIGGSGVVTLAQVLTAAALLAGREVRALDQTGLAQKGGAVVSDIKISESAIGESSKASAGECDLYLGCDLLVAADARNLAVTAPGRTVAVVSTSKVPTGRMVADASARFPDADDLGARIREATRAERSVFADARGLSVSLLGSDQFANMFLTGVALQAGVLPLPAAAVEEAIELNGVQVRQNLQALRRGRQYVADPVAFASALAALAPPVAVHELTTTERSIIDVVGSPAGSELERVITVRVPDLVAYQSVKYARDYAQFVARVRAAEQRIAAGTELSVAVARYLYKLMAYKDEYEVARLSLDPQARAAVRAEFGPGAKEYYLLHPPILRAVGRKGKLRLGPWFRPAFVVLRMLKPLRGTAFDPFGYTRVRRTERELHQRVPGHDRRRADDAEPGNLRAQRRTGHLARHDPRLRRGQAGQRGEVPGAGARLTHRIFTGQRPAGRRHDRLRPGTGNRMLPVLPDASGPREASLWQGRTIMGWCPCPDSQRMTRPFTSLPMIRAGRRSSRRSVLACRSASAPGSSAGSITSGALPSPACPPSRSSTSSSASRPSTGPGRASRRWRRSATSTRLTSATSCTGSASRTRRGGRTTCTWSPSVAPLPGRARLP